MTEPRLLGGRYELNDPIGHGGMAEVFCGADVRLGRDVAVKVLRADLARDPSFQARFRREAQAAASLNAPSIVSVFDTGEDEAGVPYIVMEYVEGKTLRDLLLEQQRLPPQQALAIVADVCAALEVAHAAGIVHRDIKPANVMVNRSGEVKVMDFGIARAASDTSSAMTQTAAVIGTAAYLSPEQARGEHVDGRSDLYSTGCLLYELLTGGPPFTGDNPVAVAYQHVREQPQPPSTYVPALSDDVDAVVLTAMAKSPAARYASAAEMRADLLRAAAGEQVQASAFVAQPAGLAPAAVTTTPARTRRDDSGKRAAAYTVFGLVLVAIVVGVALLVRGVLGGADVVPAPTLVGLDQEQAGLRLAEVGLRVGEVEERFDPQPLGTVLEQSPQAGLVVNEGGEVDLVVSLGVEQTVVPEQVIGLDLDDARLLLGDSKLTVGEVVERNGNIPEGQVLEIRPPGGQTVEAGTPVDLVVASGRVEVPDVRGASQDEAVAALQASGFEVGIQRRADPGPPGLVIAQSPVNSLAPRGATITIGVSEAPPPPSPSPSPSPTASPSPSTSPSPDPSRSPGSSPSPSPSPSPAA